MELKAGFKHTELGVLPQEWSVLSVKAVANPVRGGSPRPAGDPRYFGGSYMPWLTVSSLTNIPTSQLVVSETATSLTEEGAKRSRKLLPGTVIIANSGATLGVAKILGISCCANDGIAALLNLSQRVSAHYLVHLVNAKTKYLREMVASGNGQPNLNTSLIGGLRISLPPISEQGAIANALSDTDALIASLEQLLAKKRRIKQGAMQELFTARSRLPGFNGNWSDESLDQLGRWRGGMTPSMRRKDYWVPGSVPWISSGDVKSPKLTRAGFSVSQRAIREGATTVVPANTVLIVVRSGILRNYLPVAMTMVPMAINQDIKALVPKPTVVAEFVMQSLMFNGSSILARCLKSGTTVESIEFKWLKDFQILLPPHSEQVAIATVLSAMDAEIETLEAKVVKARQLKQAMMQELLTGRIRLVDAKTADDL